MSWKICVVDQSYEINTEFPYAIRRRFDKKVIKEFNADKGYKACKLNRKFWLKHRIIALQFIPNPENKPFIDHIDHNRSNNHIKNLRWVSQAENLKNTSSYSGRAFEFFDEINEDSIEILEYGNHKFKDFYYDPELDSFFVWNDIKFRKLTVCFSNGSAYVRAYDTNGKKVQVRYKKFLKLYGLL